MKRPEPLYGYVIALELLVVAIANLAVTHGKGASHHPPTAWAIAGMAASVALIAVVRLHNRFLVVVATMAAAIVVTHPNDVPDSVRSSHVFALVFPFVYVFILIQRQRASTRSAARAQAAAGERSPARRAGHPAVERRRGRTRRGRALPAVTGPSPSRRYTPPKAKRQRGS